MVNNEFILFSPLENCLLNFNHFSKATAGVLFFFNAFIYRILISLPVLIHTKWHYIKSINKAQQHACWNTEHSNEFISTSKEISDCSPS